MSLKSCHWLSNAFSPLPAITWSIFNSIMVKVLQLCLCAYFFFSWRPLECLCLGSVALEITFLSTARYKWKIMSTLYFCWDDLQHIPPTSSFFCHIFFSFRRNGLEGKGTIKLVAKPPQSSEVWVSLSDTQGVNLPQGFLVYFPLKHGWYFLLFCSLSCFYPAVWGKITLNSPMPFLSSLFLPIWARVNLSLFRNPLPLLWSLLLLLHKSVTFSPPGSHSSPEFGYAWCWNLLSVLQSSSFQVVMVLVLFN